MSVRFQLPRNLILLVSLSSLFVLYPFVSRSRMGPYLLQAIISIALVSAAASLVRRRRWLVGAVTLALIALLLNYAGHFYDLGPAEILSDVVYLCFFLYCLPALTFSLFLQPKVTLDVLFGAVCAYLLLGIIFGLVFTLLELLQPDSFQWLDAYTTADDLPNFFYFSYVTLSTLGYGDILPVSAPAQMLSAFEAVLGQVYLAFLFAMLLGMFLTQRTGGSQGRDGE